MTEDIMADIDELVKEITSINDALDLALTIENQGQKFYAEKAKTVFSIEAKDLFIYLAGEEAKHIEYLNEFQRTGDVTTIKHFHPAEFTASFDMEFTGEKPGEIDVLMGALSFEQKNVDFYHRLATRADNSGQKEFFMAMTSFEHKHLELIDGFIDAATQFRMQT